ncbi:hypothetical protein GCM10010269_35260 [Streptomyces humidus]|uniref:Uncharacterized protein n=1 Tax=Streptomyces humidus TaxID=52259 RepID=A0A918L442_9ACTN|nr:hypothetical protein GCM10010269_35260 [Streptomyces humidus]
MRLRVRRFAARRTHEDGLRPRIRAAENPTESTPADLVHPAFPHRDPGLTALGPRPDTVVHRHGIHTCACGYGDPHA